VEGTGGVYIGGVTWGGADKRRMLRMRVRWRQEGLKKKRKLLEKIGMGERPLKVQTLPKKNEKKYRFSLE